MHRDRLPYLLISVAALIAIVPLLANGCSCGHDFDFHLLSWMEAARQFTHGNLHPHWAYTPAWNAGEPRFVFYPPLSWIIGAVLGLIFPWTWTPILYTWLALSSSGLALYYLARDFTTPTAATLAAVLYTVNPYMLFTAFERTAYAELLAAAVVPLLLHSVLRKEITIPRIAIPIALLWLTNAPAAVMSCYVLALLTAIRLATNPGGPSFAVSSRRVGYSRHARTVVIETSNVNRSTQTPLQLFLNTIAGTALGLGLAAFYVLPAAYERRFVQIAMAIIPNMRIQDNFLFHHTDDALHNQVLHTASFIAVVLIAATAIAITLAHIRRRLSKDASSRPAPERASRVEGGVERPPHFFNEDANSIAGILLPSLAILTIVITLLLTPITAFIWSHAPELVFLQFPWRLLAILAAVLGLSIALALTRLNLKAATVTAIALAMAVALTYPAYTAFHQTCDDRDTIQARQALFDSNQGTDPTDEYTPATADNDSIAHTDPPYWLSPDPNSKAPTDTQPAAAPTHITLNATTPEDLVLNLRDYPAWRITLNGTPITTRIQRDDGLIALPVPTGPSNIDITYTQLPDQTLGDILSFASLALLLFLLRIGRKIPWHNHYTFNNRCHFDRRRRNCRRSGETRFSTANLNEPFATHSPLKPHTSPLIYHQHQMDPSVKSLLLSGAQLTDAALERLLPSPDTLPHSIHRAMRHSVFAGGKRLRPILCKEAARMVAGTGEIPEGAANLGAALEMLHTYSLIHDDLPALDNDDLRRGKPTCHVVFGEATAILAGDALQTLAFQTISALPTPPATTVAILREVSLAVGTGVGRVGDLETKLPPGMIGGQVMDIESEGVAPTAELVEAIHRAKTGALITTSIVSGGLLGLSTTPGAPEPALSLPKGLDSGTWVHRLRTFGEKAGLAFQIVDDVLDMTQSSAELGKTAGKDTASIKATWPAVFGIERSLKDAEELIADAFAALEPFGPAANPLKSLAQYLVERKN